MKKINSILFSLMAVFVMFSCGDGTVEDTTPDNYLEVNGVSYDLTSGVINQDQPNLEASPQYRKFTFEIESSSSNPTSYINFSIYSPSTTSLSDGTYTYQYWGAANNCSDIKIGFDLVYESYTAVSGTIISESYLDDSYNNTISVASSGDDNIYTFDLKFIKDNTTYLVKGRYEGALTAGYGY